MGIIHFIVLVIVSMIVFTIIDFVWLGVIAKSLYINEMGELLRTRGGNSIAPRLIPVILFYIMYNCGLVFFAIIKGGIDYDSYFYAFLFGALFGFFTYGTYELTNWAVLSSWSVKLTFIDWFWGTFLSGTVGLIVYMIYVNIVSKF
ncbi:MAG: membrane protein [Candidatus Dojkabacteria bacterium]|nr:MAG: membrane protein [Candidatus Dojkabacteria bacterium]